MKTNALDFLQKAFNDRDTSRFNGFDFVHAFGSGRDALMYAQIFWPNFTEFHGMVFHEFAVEHEVDRQRLLSYYEAQGRNPQSTQESFNLVEVGYLFGARSGESDEHIDLALAELLCEMWSFRLKSLFPKLEFKVAIIPPEEVNDEIAITFFQVE